MNIGEYKVTTERSENSLYRWVEAVNTQKEKTVIIQILQPGISPEITAQINGHINSISATAFENSGMSKMKKTRMLAGAEITWAVKVI